MNWLGALTHTWKGLNQSPLCATHLRINEIVNTLLTHYHSLFLSLSLAHSEKEIEPVIVDSTSEVSYYK